LSCRYGVLPTSLRQAPANGSPNQAHGQQLRYFCFICFCVCEIFDLIRRKVSPQPDHRPIAPGTITQRQPQLFHPTSHALHLSLLRPQWHTRVSLGILAFCWSCGSPSFRGSMSPKPSRKRTAPMRILLPRTPAVRAFPNKLSLPERANLRNRIVSLPIQWQLPKPVLRICLCRSARCYLLVFKYHAERVAVGKRLQSSLPWLS
jgi:hypothetical protein